jgi:hypothetical protein
LPKNGNFKLIPFFEFSKGFTMAQILDELVKHGQSRYKSVAGKPRSKEQAKQELLNHYKNFHDEDEENDDLQDEESGSSMDLF